MSRLSVRVLSPECTKKKKKQKTTSTKSHTLNADKRENMRPCEHVRVRSVVYTPIVSDWPFGADKLPAARTCPRSTCAHTCVHSV